MSLDIFYPPSVVGVSPTVAADFLIPTVVCEALSVLTLLTPCHEERVIHMMDCVAHLDKSVLRVEFLRPPKVMCVSSARHHPLVLLARHYGFMSVATISTATMTTTAIPPKHHIAHLLRFHRTLGTGNSVLRNQALGQVTPWPGRESHRSQQSLHRADQ